MLLLILRKRITFVRSSLPMPINIRQVLERKTFLKTFIPTLLQTIAPCSNINDPRKKKENDVPPL